MNIKEIKFLMERIESNKRLTDTEYRQKHQGLLKEEELKTGEGYYCALPIDSTGKNRVYVKVKFLGKSKDGELIVTPLEEVRFMVDGRNNAFGEGKQFGTSMEFMLTKTFGSMKE